MTERQGDPFADSYPIFDWHHVCEVPGICVEVRSGPKNTYHALVIGRVTFCATIGQLRRIWSVLDDYLTAAGDALAPDPDAVAFDQPAPADQDTTDLRPAPF